MLHQTYSKLIAAVLTVSAFFSTHAQVIDFEKYNPPSTLVVPMHPLQKAKFPFIDVHNHQRNMGESDLDKLIADMDKLNMQVMVNLSGGNGENLKSKTAAIRAKYPGRFIVFANIDFTGIGNAGWTEKAVAQLEADVRNGANGLKIFKNLGFSVNDVSGQRVTVDDPRLDAIWDKCGELKIPVLIHTADPESFWRPLDETNERWLELKLNPGRKRADDNPAPWQTLIDEQHRMFKKHPKTTFIAAHFGWYPNNLMKLDSILSSLPNVVVEFGAVIAEIGRQPRNAKAFFEKFQDRILFGKDSWVPSEYPTYFRVLETNDEYFPYHKKYHAFWAMYGMGLSDAVLRKVYYKNALRIIPNIDKSQFPKE
jgi:predicted TIM-barrel fold metal-dependent hydrolase